MTNLHRLLLVIVLHWCAPLSMVSRVLDWVGQVLSPPLGGRFGLPVFQPDSHFLSRTSLYPELLELPFLNRLPNLLRVVTRLRESFSAF